MKSLLVFVFIFGCAVNVCYSKAAKPAAKVAPGGILDANGEYVPGSVLVWVRVSQSASCHVSKCGQKYLLEWEQASKLFDKYMLCGNLCKAYDQFYVALAKFKAVITEIRNNEVLRLRFQTTYNEFGAILANGLKGSISFVDISNYMAYAHGPFHSSIKEITDKTFKCCSKPKTYA